MSDDKTDRPRRPPSIMGDDERATIGRRSVRILEYRPEQDDEATPPPVAIDPAMQELINRFWPLRHIEREHAEDRLRDQERLIKLATDVARLDERVNNISEFGDALGELAAIKADNATLRREIWGDEPRKPDEPPLAKQARSGRRLLALIIGIATVFGTTAAGGILVSVRKSAEAEGEERAWRAQVNSQIQMLLSAVFRVDMNAHSKTPPPMSPVQADHGKD